MWLSLETDYVVMPVYSYRALNAQGKMVRGVVDADNPQRARQRLRSDGLHPMELQTAPKSRIKGQSRRRTKRFFNLRRNRMGLLAETTRQLATLLAAGLPLVSALSTAQEQTEDPSFGHLLAEVREAVTGGESLAGALEQHPQAFPAEYIHLIRAGEMSGALDHVMGRLADNLEKNMNRRAKVASALAYPAFMTLVGIGVLFFLLSFIIPSLTGLFDNLGAALPWPTRLLLALSSLMQEYWWAVFLAGCGLVLLINRYFKKDVHYRRFETLVFRVPVFGTLVKKLLLAQALRGLAIMTGGGVSLTTALTVTATGMGRSSFAEALRLAAQWVGQGRSLADGLQSSGLFPPVARRMVAAGEASGTLTDMLARVARAYEEETDRVLTTLTSLIEPVIIVIMGLLVGFIVLAVLLPIFDLSGIVG